jgi:peptidyl-prolyl cis-trans isomerase SurA
MSLIRRSKAFAFPSAFALLLGCAASQPPVVLEVGPEKVLLDEFEYFYERNVGTRETTKESQQEDREKFLDLLTNYKLKIRDAYDRNLLNDPEVQKELREYRTSVASTFLIEKEMKEPALRKMYDRRKMETRASHILFRLGPNPTPEETLTVWNKAVDVINQLKSGKDFAELAQEVSEDPSARQNKGDLMFFTAGQMVGEFEDAAFSLRPGEINRSPVRTPFGYHIIKVTDRRPAIHSISVRHLMVMHRKGADSLDVDSALVRINDLMDSLKAGHDFAELARKYSEDGGTAPRGGNLGYFQRRRFVPDFEQAAFSLKVGEISPVVRTVYGYHIIKCEDIKQIPPYEEMRSELQNVFQQTRNNFEYRRFVDDFRQRFRIQVDEQALAALIAVMDSTNPVVDSVWLENIPAEIRRQAIITSNRRSMSIEDIVGVLGTQPEYRQIVFVPSQMNQHIERAADILALDLASERLEGRYPDFEALMKEFRDGVVLYKAEQLEVWNRIDMNEDRLRTFYEERKTNYPLPDRVEFVEISAANDSLLQRIIRDVKRGRNLDTAVARLKDKVEKKNRGLIAANIDTVASVAWGSDGKTLVGPIRYNNKSYLIKTIRKDPARLKTFEEASAELSTLFQDHEAKRLESEWLGRLREKYPVVQHREHLTRALGAEKPAS